MQIKESQDSRKPTSNVPPLWRTFRWLLLFAILPIVVLLALTVWPTLYRYEKLTAGQVTMLVRINRITGATERLTPTSGEWRPVKRTATMHPLPSTELGKISSSLYPFIPSGGPGVSGRIYNGSNWAVREVIIRVTARKKAGLNSKDEPFSRLYPVPDLNISPLEVKSFHIELPDLGELQWEWMKVELAEAWGYQVR